MRFSTVHALAVTLLLLSPAAAADDGAGFKPLFNGKDLDGWYTILEDVGKNRDPDKVFQIHDGVIHLYKDHADGLVGPKGYFVTQSEFSYYHLRFEYQWGGKKFAPRYEQPPDAGCLYHVTGRDVVWPSCIECQIQQGDTGDCLTLTGTQVDTTVDPKFSGVNAFQFLDTKAGGVPRTIGNAEYMRIIKASTHEKEGWNTVEVIVRGGDETVHIVNGHTVFKAKNLRKPSGDDKTTQPLPHGHIAFQAECAEVLYRKIEIRPIADGPLHPRQTPR